jgi:hypothetical protein
VLSAAAGPPSPQPKEYTVCYFRASTYRNTFGNFWQLMRFLRNPATPFPTLSHLFPGHTNFRTRRQGRPTPGGMAAPERHAGNPPVGLLGPTPAGQWRRCRPWNHPPKCTAGTSDDVSPEPVGNGSATILKKNVAPPPFGKAQNQPVLLASASLRARTRFRCVRKCASRPEWAVRRSRFAPVRKRWPPVRLVMQAPSAKKTR